MSKLQAFFKGCPIPVTPFSKEDSRDLTSLMLNSEFKELLTFDEFQAKLIGEGRLYASKDEMHQGLWVIWTRCAALDGYFRMSLGASIFLSLFTKTVGDAVMYFSYVAGKAKERGIRSITLEFLGKDLFLMGTFSEEQLKLMWSLQEEDGKNLLDNGAEWRKFLYGDGTEEKLKVHFSDTDERLLHPDDIKKIGITEPREIEGRMYFWLKDRYVNVAMEDYCKLEVK